MARLAIEHPAGTVCRREPDKRIVRVHLIVVSIGGSRRLAIQLRARELEYAPAFIIEVSDLGPQFRSRRSGRGIDPGLRTAIGKHHLPCGESQRPRWVRALVGK